MSFKKNLKQPNHHIALWTILWGFLIDDGYERAPPPVGDIILAQIVMEVLKKAKLESQ